MRLSAKVLVPWVCLGKLKINETAWKSWRSMRLSRNLRSMRESGNVEDSWDYLEILKFHETVQKRWKFMRLSGEVEDSWDCLETLKIHESVWKNWGSIRLPRNFWKFMRLSRNFEDPWDCVETMKIYETVWKSWRSMRLSRNSEDPWDVWKRGEGECSYVHVKRMLSTQKSVLLLAGFNTSFNWCLLFTRLRICSPVSKSFVSNCSHLTDHYEQHTSSRLIDFSLKTIESDSRPVDVNTWIKNWPRVGLNKFVEKYMHMVA
jgi:hypothetical protein